ncbi:hypothetical protein [Undibacterium terreum]|uniref:hypothetical protein n=1 Tax=Undibacterium terreum TaxID=1224302 RepID=UPI00166604D0|nr:hypothetical protein [Undibacterium terreum]
MAIRYSEQTIRNYLMVLPFVGELPAKSVISPAPSAKIMLKKPQHHAIAGAIYKTLQVQNRRASPTNGEISSKSNNQHAEFPHLPYGFMNDITSPELRISIAEMVGSIHTNS